MDDCVFCQIANKTKAADMVVENDELMVLHDLLPKAPVHLLIISKKHIPSITSLTGQDRDLVGNMILMAQQAAAQAGIADSGYKLPFNVGKDGGQTISHLHLHLRGGKQLPE